MVKSVFIKKSEISGKGIFANRSFSKGEIVLKWHPRPLKKSEIKNFPKKEAAFIERLGKRFYLMQAPERYMNHSCDSNTLPKGKSDVAIRDIEKGEEITSDYSGHGIESFVCRCGSKKCRKIVC